MTRLIAIPVTGTVAALIVILLAHEPRGDSEPEPAPPLLDTLPDISSLAADQPPPPPPPPAPEPREYQLQVNRDGGLRDLESGKTYPDIKSVIDELGDARHTIVVTNEEGVAEAALDTAMAALRDRFEMRKIYRAPKK